MQRRGKNPTLISKSYPRIFLLSTPPYCKQGLHVYPVFIVFNCLPFFFSDCHYLSLQQPSFMKKSISFKLLTLLSINCLNLSLLNSLLEEGCQNPYFMKPSPPILPTPFLKFRPSLLPLPPPPNLHAHCSFDSTLIFTSTLI